MMNRDGRLSALNAGYLLDLYERYLQDPASVEPETREFFSQWTPDEIAEERELVRAAPTPQVRPSQIVSTLPPVTRIAAAVTLAQAIRERGHLAARIDPLGKPPTSDPSLELQTHGLTEEDLAALPATVVDGPVAEGAPNSLEAINRLRRIYSGTTGYEFEHLEDPDERDWLRFAVESGQYRKKLTNDERIALLRRLTEVETFERFLHRTFVGQKRFSIEGNDVLVPMLDVVIRSAAMAGAREVLMGMAHRGRLNVLAHVLGKSYTQIFTEFHDPSRRREVAPTEASDTGWTGDVKYHLGARRAYRQLHGGTGGVTVTLAPNPSHLEFVDPVVEGMTRAAQEDCESAGQPLQRSDAALAILIHGDAAFPGEGVVAETLNLAALPGYTTGGTVHIIVNNQLGFTTEPDQGRSTLYASDLAKGFEIPIVHVNADDPEACLQAARLAHDYRARFRKDFLIDLVGYRRWGHNETDEPAFTQPMMYRVIDEHPTVRELWAAELERQNVIRPGEAQRMVDDALERLQEAQRGLPSGTAEARTASARTEYTPAWGQVGSSMPQGAEENALRQQDGEVETAVKRSKLLALNAELTRWPRDFHINPKLERLYDRRREAPERDGGIDWAHAELLAFATILADGRPIRLTGQDVERGTFSQRHLVLHDIQNAKMYTPLRHLSAARASFAIHNSPLSEIAPIGFEYGYSVHANGTLVLWEAQFGDFVNVAQAVIDTFIVSGQAKWHQNSGLVLLLPHGYEGQGPEHSSARLERFLQLAANGNIRVAYPTSGAQYFHLLRRQAALLEVEPRPLVVMTPKSLLRLGAAASSFEDLATGRFQTVIDDPRAREHPETVERLILCSGKLYYDLLQAAGEQQPEKIAIVRVEQLYPFPRRELRAVLARYRNLRELVWAQEEPMNMGAWGFVVLRLGNLLQDMAGNVPLLYAGRPERSSPAEGSAELHEREQARVIAMALGADGAVKMEARGVRHVA